MTKTVDRIRAKVTRANQHIEDFQLALRAFYDTKPYSIRIKEDSEAGKRIYYLGEVTEVPMNVEAIAADARTNLRSVLDQLAYQLEWLGCGAEPKQRVYYPIAKSAAEYPALRDRNIKCAGRAAIDAIDATEPYKDGKGHALWQLNELHKVDDHRLLVAAGSYFSGVEIASGMVQRMRRLVDWEIPDLPPLFIVPADKLLPLKAGDELYLEPLDEEVDEKRQFTFDVSFYQPGIIEGEPALKTLQDMTNLVDDLVAAFEPLFL